MQRNLGSPSFSVVAGTKGLAKEACYTRLTGQNPRAQSTEASRGRKCGIYVCFPNVPGSSVCVCL